MKRFSYNFIKSLYGEFIGNNSALSIIIQDQTVKIFNIDIPRRRVPEEVILSKRWTTIERL